MKRKSLIISVLLSVLSITTMASGSVREYGLTIAEEPVHIDGKTANGMTINGKIPGPTLFFRKGDLARIHVTNTMSVSTSIHWHGLLVPPLMDGVPMVTQPPIEPGATFTYEFPIRQTGTYWYHSHSELQEQRGLYGSIVIEDNQTADRDYVVLLSDWTTDNPDSVMRTLKRGSEWFSLQKGSAQSIAGAFKAGRLSDYFLRELQRMPPMDISDVAYDYFLANGTPQHALLARKGETVRIRIINGSATTYFHINYAAGPMTIISADGQLVEQLEKEIFLIGVAETYDVLVKIPNDGAYELRATAHDGSGFASTWLGSGRKYPAPSIPMPNLYVPMQHGGGSLFALTPPGTMGMPDQLIEQGYFDQPGMMHGMEHNTGTMKDDSGEGGHQGHTMNHALSPSTGTADHKMENTQSFVGGKSTMEAGQDKEIDAEIMDMTMDDMPHAQGDSMVHDPAMAENNASQSARRFGGSFGFLAADISSRKHLAVEGSSQRPFAPYDGLKSRVVTALPADASVREVRLTLDGDMERYTWFLNKKPLSETDHILIKEGEVVRFIMINRTMMHHPMHLHGHFFRVLNGQGEYSPLKHTVDVEPMSTTVIEFYGNEVGDWFFHCHLLYHMKSGMARMVHYQDFTTSEEVMAVRPRLYKDPLYFYGEADILNSMTEGVLTVTNSRLEFKASWEVGWQEVEDTEWEGLLTADYHLNRFTSFFLGADILGEDSSTEDFRGVIGLRYLLPLNAWSSVWVDTDGGTRWMLEKEFELTPRFGLHGEVEYDSHDGWEGKVGLGYILSKNISLLANWHSEYEFGAGLQVRF